MLWFLLVAGLVLVTNNSKAMLLTDLSATTMKFTVRVMTNKARTTMATAMADN